MLKQRLLTAALLVPLVVLGVLWLPSAWLAGGIGLVVLLAAHELARIAGLDGRPSLWLYDPILAAVLLFLYQLDNQFIARVLIACAGLAWLLMTAWLLSGKPDVDSQPPVRWALLAIGGLLFAAAWLALVRLHEQADVGPKLLLFVLVLVWVADSGAYFAGKRWGRRKLAPRISPGKTVQGLYGALASACVFALLVSGLPPFSQLSLIGFVGLCAVTTVVSVGGDLWESLWKRRSGVKDSGTLLPGHGGLWDRIDSLIAAGPVFYIGVWALADLN